MPFNYFVKYFLDKFVKALKMRLCVIAAKAGIQYFQRLTNPWTPGFAKVTTFHETINYDELVKSSRCKARKN